MFVEFQNTLYLWVIQNHSNEFISNEQIEERVKASLDFSYTQGDYERFDEIHLAKGRFGRKVLALPKFLISGCIKTLYHLAQAFFLGLGLAFVDNGAYFKAHIFSFVRDLQESFGHLATIFHDSYGQYHVEEANFHKSCYAYYGSLKNAMTNKSLEKRVEQLEEVVESKQNPNQEADVVHLEFPGIDTERGRAAYDVFLDLAAQGRINLN